MKRIRLVSIIALAILLCALVIAPAYASFGGGSHSSGGSSSGGSSSGSSSYSGGSSSSGSSGGSSSGSPICGILVMGLFVVIFGAIFYNNIRQGKHPMAGFRVNGQLIGDDGKPVTGASTAPIIPQVDPNTLLAQLSTNDPNFNMMALNARVNEMFYALQMAWSARDISKVSHFIYPQMYATYNNMVQDLKNRKVINIIETPVLQDVRPVNYSQSGGYDFLTVQITASMVDYEIDENTKQIVFAGVGKPINSKPEPRQLRERWTLVRKTGVQTNAARTTINQCPNCNAPAKLEGQNKCDYCGTAFNNPDFDWVLAQLEQVDF